jgi:hypothetical protein
LRPGITTGLPFRGCEAAGLVARTALRQGREPALQSNDEKHASQIRALAKSQNSYPKQTYVRLPGSQICGFKETCAIWASCRARAVDL